MSKLAVAVIAGGREFDDMNILLEMIDKVREAGFEIAGVFSGACRLKKSDPYKFASGADGLGERWALARGLAVERFYAEDFGEWPSCGPIRNNAMAEAASKMGGILIALPGGIGTERMIQAARRHKMRVFECIGGYSFNV